MTEQSRIAGPDFSEFDASLGKQGRSLHYTSLPNHSLHCRTLTYLIKMFPVKWQDAQICIVPVL